MRTPQLQAPLEISGPIDLAYLMLLHWIEPQNAEKYQNKIGALEQHIKELTECATIYFESDEEELANNIHHALLDYADEESDEGFKVRILTHVGKHLADIGNVAKAKGIFVYAIEEDNLAFRKYKVPRDDAGYPGYRSYIYEISTAIAKSPLSEWIYQYSNITLLGHDDLLNFLNHTSSPSRAFGAITPQIESSNSSPDFLKSIEYLTRVLNPKKYLYFDGGLYKEVFDYAFQMIDKKHERDYEHYGVHKIIAAWQIILDTLLIMYENFKNTDKDLSPTVKLISSVFVTSEKLMPLISHPTSYPLLWVKLGHLYFRFGKIELAHAHYKYAIESELKMVKSKNEYMDQKRLYEILEYANRIDYTLEKDVFLSIMEYLQSRYTEYEKPWSHESQHIAKDNEPLEIFVRIILKTGNEDLIRELIQTLEVINSELVLHKNEEKINNWKAKCFLELEDKVSAKECMKITPNISLVDNDNLLLDAFLIHTPDNARDRVVLYRELGIDLNQLISHQDPIGLEWNIIYKELFEAGDFNGIIDYYIRNPKLVTPQNLINISKELASHPLPTHEKLQERCQELYSIWIDYKRYADMLSS